MQKGGLCEEGANGGPWGELREASRHEERRCEGGRGHRHGVFSTQAWICGRVRSVGQGGRSEAGLGLQAQVTKGMSSRDRQDPAES